MTIPFPSAEDSNGKPAKEGAEKTKPKTATGGSLFWFVLGYYRGLVANSLKWQSSDCYYAVARNSVWILLIKSKKSPILVKDFT
jgi:hypothetical protein